MKLKLCFIADARSPIAQDWIGYFIRRGHDVHVLSSFACDPAACSGAKFHVLPNPMGIKGRRDGLRAKVVSSSGRLSPISCAVQRVWNAVCRPALAVGQAPAAYMLVRRIRPDVLHALRVPTEGETAGLIAWRPLVLSVWGNDFTLHAAQSSLHRLLTRRALCCASAVIADCRRDIRDALEFGLPASMPTAVLVGSGGIRRDLFHSGPANPSLRGRLGIPADARIVINPRGLRTYVRNDTFLEVVYKLSSQMRDVVFVGVGLKGWPPAERLAASPELSPNLILTPVVPKVEMADLFRLASVSVSITEHDGTPNSLLEAMACGCVPVCGDLPSIREWITAGINGLLVDPGDPDAVGRAVVRALGDAELRSRARLANDALIRQRADYATTMEEAEQLYVRLATNASAQSGMSLSCNT